MVKVKLVHNKEVRRYDVPAGRVYETLIALTRSEFKLDSFQLHYEDDEKDFVTMTNESDTQEALDLAQKGGQVLKVFVAEAHPVHTSASPSQPEEEWVKFPAAEVESEDRKMEEQKSKPAPGPEATFDWVAMCEDFLASKDVQAGQEKLIEVVFAGVAQGRKVSDLIIDGLQASPFKDHPFIKNGLDQMKALLLKADAYGFILLRAGRPGIEMALPSVLRGFAKFMQTGQSAPVLVDLADVFKQLFPQWFHMLQALVPNGQTVDLNIGKILASMQGARPGEPSMSEEAATGPAAEPAIDPEVAEAAKEGITIHKGRTCDLCNTGPIIGIRYKCMACADFDMCEDCAQKKLHNAEHPLLKLSKPMPRGGFCVGRDRLPGAAEMFTPPWMKHKRRAMKKYYKAMKKHGGEQETPAADQPWRRRGMGRRGGGKCRGGFGGGHQFRRWFMENVQSMWQPGASSPGAGPSPPWAGSGACGRATNEDELMDLDTPSSGSSSSSDSSDSSDSEGASSAKIASQKASLKKMRKKHKKLVMKVKKVARKVNGLKKAKSKIERKLAKAVVKQKKVVNDLRQKKFELEKAEEGARKEKELRASKKKASKKKTDKPKGGFAMFQESIQQAKSPVTSTPAPELEPEEMKIDETTDRSYVKELKLLKEMGFSDEELCLRLLEENDGDLKNVVVVLATAAGSKI